MGSTACSSCGKPMWDGASVCPHCGTSAAGGPAVPGPAEPIGQGSPPSGNDFLLAPWPQVRRGLATYRSGLIAKLAVVIPGAILIFLAAWGRSVGAVKFLLIATTLGSFLTSIWMLAGLVGYAKVPDRTGGRGAATFSLVLMVIGLLLEAYVVYLVFSLFGGRLGAAFSAMKQMPYLEAISQVLGLLAIVSLLISFSAVARFCGYEMGDRTRTTGTLIVATAAASFLLRMLTAQRVIRSAGVSLLFALGVLVLAIVALVSFLNVLRDMQRATQGPD
jgi:hypothetical protein